MVALTGGCQFHTNANSGAIGADAPGASDASVDTAVDAAPPAPFVLAGLRWLMPCTHTLNNQNCHCAGPATVDVAVPGTGRWMVTVTPIPTTASSRSST